MVHVAEDDLLAPHIDGDGAAACNANLNVVNRYQPVGACMRQKLL